MDCSGIERRVFGCRRPMRSWLPGTEGGGVADVLFGAYPPAGRLNHVWPETMQQVPIHQESLQSEPLFERGFGLRYAPIKENE